LFWLTLVAAPAAGWWVDHRRIDLVATALDAQCDVDLRIEAAAQLREHDKAALRSVIVSELPGDWDLRALDAIKLLSIVGDADTADFLDWLEALPVARPGKFGSTIRYVNSQIRVRAH
jgi:hypothetical protein